MAMFFQFVTTVTMTEKKKKRALKKKTLNIDKGVG
jgi:hypothetical protein